MAYCEWTTLYADEGDSRETAVEFYVKILGEIRAMILRPRHTWPPGLLNHWFRAHVELNYYRHHQPFIKLYPGIAEMLSTTKIDIPCEECHLPFDGFMIQLPNDTKVTIADPATGEGVPVCSVMVSETNLEIARAVGVPLGVRSIIVQWVSQPDSTGQPLIEGLAIVLRDGVTINEAIKYSIAQAQTKGANVTVDEVDQMFRIAIGAIFLAISKDRRYVSQERKRTKSNQPCFCGSGKKYKKCCGKSNREHTGLGIGREISLPSGTVAAPRTEGGTGRELKHSHLRSGHMAWQRYGPGRELRKLIFRHPLMVRPELGLPPGGPTPRRIDKPPKRWRRRSRRNPGCRRCRRCGGCNRRTNPSRYGIIDSREQALQYLEKPSVEPGSDCHRRYDQTASRCSCHLWDEPKGVYHYEKDKHPGLWSIVNTLSGRTARYHLAPGHIYKNTPRTWGIFDTEADRLIGKVTTRWAPFDEAYDSARNGAIEKLMHYDHSLIEEIHERFDVDEESFTYGNNFDDDAYYSARSDADDNIKEAIGDLLGDYSDKFELRLIEGPGDVPPLTIPPKPKPKPKPRPAVPKPKPKRKKWFGIF